MTAIMIPPLRYVSITAGAVLVMGTAVAYFARKHRKSPAQRERERREFLNHNGRISDGTVFDFTELPNPANPVAAPAQLLIYQYEISGVHYEAAQDVTDLTQYIDVHNCRLGLPASVRYDPLAPQNSMVVSESWSGIRTGIFLYNSELNPHADRGPADLKKAQKI